MSCCKQNGAGEFDIKKVQEQAAALEKDLIMKELETLDILEELGATKRIVEEFKQQLQGKPLNFQTTPVMRPEDHTSTPSINEVNMESYRNIGDGHQAVVVNSCPCPMSSPDLILMELKQAKLNIGKTINDLGVIQTSVQSLNKKIKKDRTFLEKTRERLTPKISGSGVPAGEEEVKQMKVSSQVTRDPEIHSSFGAYTNVAKVPSPLNSEAEKLKNMTEPEKDEVSRAISAKEPKIICMETAEMRWIAAKKMEEAARAAEAVALAEIKALSNNEVPLEFPLAEREKKVYPFRENSPLDPRYHNADFLHKRNLMDAMFHFNEADYSRMTILRKLEEATDEFKHSKEALQEALKRIEIANKKHLAAEDALRRWTPEQNQKLHAMYNNTSVNHLHHPPHNQEGSFSYDVNQSDIRDRSKPVLRPTISMRDVLSRKQILPQDFAASNHTESQTARPKVALSQMLQELRQDLTYPVKAESEGSEQKQFIPQRKKFGFIHISLPLPKHIKRKTQNLNPMSQGIR